METEEQEYVVINPQNVIENPEHFEDNHQINPFWILDRLKQEHLHDMIYILTPQKWHKVLIDAQMKAFSFQLKNMLNSLKINV